jgi:hypothetical protein
METVMRTSVLLLMVLATGLIGTAAVAQTMAASAITQPPSQGMRLELQKPFDTRSPWLLVVTEGAPTKDYGDNDAPGALTFCLQKGPSGSCVPGPVTPTLRTVTPDNPVAWEPHYLLKANMVYPQGPKAAPLLWLVAGSLNAGDGGQVIYTQLIAYDSEHDTFVRVYENRTGSNNNQETRFITGGPLRGSVISAEPQQQPPYGFWMVVSKRLDAGAYRQVLRYASATRYNDGNALAVIDSEMPNILQRLGLWKPGQPIPIPDAADKKPCLKPTLKHAELWCE